MNDAFKAIALQEAVKFVAGQPDASVASTYRQFLALLSQDDAAAPAANTPGKEPAVVKATPPAPPKKAETKAPPAKAAPVKPAPTKTEEEVVAEATAQTEEAATVADVNTALSALIAAGARAEAVALLAEYGAKKSSEVPAASYGELVARASDMLLTI